MKVLDFTKETDELQNKLIKLGFHYQSTDKEEKDGLRNSSRLLSTWVNVRNDVTLRIIKNYDRYGDETNEYVRITDDCTNASANMSVEEFMELEQITNSHGSTFPRLGNILQKNYQRELRGHAK
ncbi:hypothetical protein [Bifidobacterium pseudocatenulatum]|uniref:hypothetical protein n=1 Tax=Bifidobacterium pseudocatenulatum TaxID=28026 RepID=UPI003D05120C